MIIMRYNQELSSAEIGKILCISRFAVNRKLKKYHKEMKGCQTTLPDLKPDNNLVTLLPE